jgi:chromosome segregation ATPase
LASADAYRTASDLKAFRVKQAGAKMETKDQKRVKKLESILAAACERENYLHRALDEHKRLVAQFEKGSAETDAAVTEIQKKLADTETKLREAEERMRALDVAQETISAAREKTELRLHAVKLSLFALGRLLA